MELLSLSNHRVNKTLQQQQQQMMTVRINCVFVIFTLPRVRVYLLRLFNFFVCYLRVLALL